MNHWFTTTVTCTASLWLPWTRTCHRPRVAAQPKLLADVRGVEVLQEEVDDLLAVTAHELAALGTDGVREEAAHLLQSLCHCLLPE